MLPSVIEETAVRAQQRIFMHRENGRQTRSLDRAGDGGRQGFGPTMNVNHCPVPRQFRQQGPQGFRGGTVPDALDGGIDFGPVSEEIGLAQADGPDARVGESRIDRADRGEDDRFMAAPFEPERAVEGHLGLASGDVSVIKHDDDSHGCPGQRHGPHPSRFGPPGQSTCRLSEHSADDARVHPPTKGEVQEPCRAADLAEISTAVGPPSAIAFDLLRFQVKLGPVPLVPSRSLIRGADWSPP